MATFDALASRTYFVTISIFCSSCSLVRLESLVEISRRKRLLVVCVFGACVRVRNARDGTAPSLAAFVVYSISRVSSLTPRFRSSSSFSVVAAQTRQVHMRACVLCSTCRGSLPMHANPVSKLSKCTRKCITDEGGGRTKKLGGRGQEGR